MAAVAELEPPERDLLFLIAWEGCSSSLAAVATGIPQSEVRSRLNAIRKEIRRRVAANDNQITDSSRDDAPDAPDAPDAGTPRDGASS